MPESHGSASAPARESSALKVTLPSDREIVMVRHFDAPRRLVFEAHSKPEHIRNWWGPWGFTMPVCEMDFRPGGAWRFVVRAPDGREHPFKGVYREIVPSERLVYSFVYDVDGMREHETTETLTFTEQNGRTTLTSHVLHQTPKSRDEQLRHGMEKGASETMERLAEHLKTMS